MPSRLVAKNKCAVFHSSFIERKGKERKGFFVFSFDQEMTLIKKHKPCNDLYNVLVSVAP